MTYRRPSSGAALDRRAAGADAGRACGALRARRSRRSVPLGWRVARDRVRLLRSRALGVRPRRDRPAAQLVRALQHRAPRAGVGHGARATSSSSRASATSASTSGAGGWCTRRRPDETSRSCDSGRRTTARGSSALGASWPLDRIVIIARVKKRLDVVLVERGLAESRSQAQALVLAGLVRGHDKPGEQVADDAVLDVERPPRFVSRGGEKLQNALDALARRRRAGATASTSARRRAASRTACSRPAPRASSRSTSATASSILGCVPIRG